MEQGGSSSAATAASVLALSSPPPSKRATPRKSRRSNDNSSSSSSEDEDDDDDDDDDEDDENDTGSSTSRRAARKNDETTDDEAGLMAARRLAANTSTISRRRHSHHQLHTNDLPESSSAATSPTRSDHDGGDSAPASPSTTTGGQHQQQLVSFESASVAAPEAQAATASTDNGADDDDDLDCPVCFNLVWPPKQLQCSHVVCEPCLSRIVHHQLTQAVLQNSRNMQHGMPIQELPHSVRCPLCRQTTPLPHEGDMPLVAHLPLNELLSRKLLAHESIVPANLLARLRVMTTPLTPNQRLRFLCYASAPSPIEDVGLETGALPNLSLATLLAAIEKYRTDDGILHEALRILQDVTHHPPEIKELALLSPIATSTNGSALVAPSPTSAGELLVSRFQLHEPIIAILRARGMEKYELARLAVRALWDLSASNSNRIVLVSNPNATHLLVAKVMQTHTNDSDIQEAGCGFLRHLSDYTPNRRLLMEPADESLAAHVIVLQAMNNLVTHGGVQRQGCGALRKLAMEPQNRAVLMSNKHQAEVAVLTAMRSHPNHNKVQKQGCAALGAFADDNTENQATLIRLKAHEAVAAAMRNHPTQAKVQSRGCSALRKLLASNGQTPPAAKDERAAIMRTPELGIPVLIFDAMRQHAKVADVQNRACRALFHLSYKNDAARAILLSTNIEYKKITQAHPVLKEIMVVSGSLELVANALFEFPNQLDVQRSACGVLWNLTHNTEQPLLLAAFERSHVNNNNGNQTPVQALILAMNRNMNNVTVLQYACGTILQLSAHPAICKKLATYNPNMIETIKRARQQHPNDAHLKKWVEQLVSRLAPRGLGSALGTLSPSASGNVLSPASSSSSLFANVSPSSSLELAASPSNAASPPSRLSIANLFSFLTLRSSSTASSGNPSGNSNGSGNGGGASNGGGV